MNQPEIELLCEFQQHIKPDIWSEIIQQLKPPTRQTVAKTSAKWDMRDLRKPVG